MIWRNCSNGLDLISLQRGTQFNEFGGIKALLEVTHKEIYESKRRVLDGRILFGMQQTKQLLAMIDWVKDRQRVNKAPGVDGFDAVTFREAILESAERQTVRASEEDTMEPGAKKNATPGMLTGESIWDKWEAQVTNHLCMCTLYGAYGVPLAYIIREDEDPPDDAEYGNFNKQCIACCPLEGPKFESNARKVHQIILYHLLQQVKTPNSRLRRLRGSRMDGVT